MSSLPCDVCKYRETKKCIGCAALEKYLESHNLSNIEECAKKPQSVPFEEEALLR